jgi:hypothetical protein
MWLHLQLNRWRFKKIERVPHHAKMGDSLFFSTSTAVKLRRSFSAKAIRYKRRAPFRSS